MILTTYVDSDVQVQNANKNAFYTIFMAFYELLVLDDLSPCDNEMLLKRLTDLQDRIKVETHYATTENRRQNFALTKCLIQVCFIKKEPSALSRGSGLAIDFENSIRRSKNETPRYEYKQGLVRLSDDRKYDKQLEDQILKSICAIANIGYRTEGYIYLGVADKDSDVQRTVELDKVTPIKISAHSVVGIDRGAFPRLFGLTKRLEQKASLERRSLPALVKIAAVRKGVRNLDEALHYYYNIYDRQAERLGFSMD